MCFKSKTRGNCRSVYGQRKRVLEGRKKAYDIPSRCVERNDDMLIIAQKLNLGVTDDNSFQNCVRQRMNAIRKLLQPVDDSNAKVGDLTVVFVFDEVRATLRGNGKAFADLRRVACEFPADSGLTVVLIDTVSRISNISPVADKDPSLRIQSGVRLFPPIYLLPTMDIFASVHDVMGRVTLPQLLNPEVLYRLGRPLWNSYINRKIPGILIYLCELMF